MREGGAMTMPELLLRAAVRALQDNDTDDAQMLIAASKEVEVKNTIFNEGERE